MSDGLRILDLASEAWERFDPKDGKVGPIEYPEYLSGGVQWLRTFGEGPLPTAAGSVGISICHMRGDPTPLFEEGFGVGPEPKAETEIMVFLEGSAEARLPDGRVVDVEAPKIVFLPRGLAFGWRYKTPYRGVYIILW